FHALSGPAIGPEVLISYCSPPPWNVMTTRSRHCYPVEVHALDQGPWLPRVWNVTDLMAAWEASERRGGKNGWTNDLRPVCRNCDARDVCSGGAEPVVYFGVCC